MALSIGERLKAAREAKGMGLEEACRITKIQRRVLEAIEQNRVEEILSPAYCRIFLRKYAGLLGLDGDALVREQQTGRPALAEPPLIRLEPAVSRPAEGGSWPWARSLLPVGTLLAVVVGAAFLTYQVVQMTGLFRRSEPSHSAVSGAGAGSSEEPLLVPQNKPLQLTVAATDKVWLQIKADGTVIFQNVLPKGSRESWTARRELELWTGNAGAMQMDLNGKRLEGLGRGVRKGVKITHSGLRAP